MIRLAVEDMLLVAYGETCSNSPIGSVNLIISSTTCRCSTESYYCSPFSPIVRPSELSRQCLSLMLLPTQLILGHSTSQKQVSAAHVVTSTSTTSFDSHKISFLPVSITRLNTQTTYTSHRKHPAAIWPGTSKMFHVCWTLCFTRRTRALAVQDCLCPILWTCEPGWHHC